MNKIDLRNKINNNIGNCFKTQFSIRKRSIHEWAIVSDEDTRTRSRIPIFPNANDITIDRIRIDDNFMEIIPRLTNHHEIRDFHLATYGYDPDYGPGEVMLNDPILELMNNYIQETKTILSNVYFNGNDDILYHISSFLSPLVRYSVPSRDLYSYLMSNGCIRGFHLYSLTRMPLKCLLKFEYLGKDVLFEGRVTDGSFKFIIDPFNQVTLDSSYSTLRLLELPLYVPLDQFISIV